VDRWPWLLAALIVLLFVVVPIALITRARRSKRTLAELPGDLKALAGDLVRLPGRLRRLAADPRTPRKARWALIGLAIYIASPIDPIPDFLPGIGHLDEAILVPIILVRIRRMIPTDIWAEYFPPRARPGTD